jgi:glycosyltransferase involved in cell wall biosynthesis
MNYNSRTPSYNNKDVLCSMLIFIPDLNGYFKERFDVMKICLGSLIMHTDKNIADILIFDQGSCEEVINYLLKLRDKGDITHLFLSSKNLGYNGAKNYIYSICQSEYLCWADDDVFFFPDWLEKSLQIAKTYPNIGTVCGSPTSNKFLKNNTVATGLPQLNQNIKQISDRWNNKWDEIFVNSIGNVHCPSENDIPLYTLNNVEAFPVNAHFQYLITRQARKALYPFKVGFAMSSSMENFEFHMEYSFDKKMDDLGFAKLSTNGLYIEHLGGTLSERTQYLAREYKIMDVNVKRNTKTNFTFFQYLIFKFMNIPYIGKFPLQVYNFLFKIIVEKKAYDAAKK